MKLDALDLFFVVLDALAVGAWIALLAVTP
jgi:hypothetical protein